MKNKAYTMLDRKAGDQLSALQSAYRTFKKSRSSDDYKLYKNAYKLWANTMTAKYRLASELGL